jgi:hypothetical protein
LEKEAALRLLGPAGSVERPGDQAPQAGAWLKRAGARRGMALLNTMLLVAVFTILLVTSISTTQTSYTAARNTKSEAQAYHVARAGLVDAINWFKRQASQPVEKFRPSYNAAVPTKGDTNDPYKLDPGLAGGNLHEDDGGGNDDKPHLGIVQEFEIDKVNGLWGRYEIGKITKLENDSQGKLRTYWVMEYDGNGDLVKKPIWDAKSKQWEGVQDVTANYGLEGEGLVWRIRSHGYVYKKSPAATAGTHFYQYPNEVLSQIELETEIRRLQLKDYNAAIQANTVVNLNGGTKVKITAPGGAGIRLNPGGSVSGSGSVSGDDGAVRVGGYNALDFNQIFALPDAQSLASMADVNVTDLSQLPSAMSTMALTYIDPPGTPGTAVFNVDRPLNGGGILVVDGNMRIEANSSSGFSGYIFVTGNFEMYSTNFIVGQVVVKGTTTVSSPSDTAMIDYNIGLVGEVRRQLGQYRERRTGVRVVE